MRWRGLGSTAAAMVAIVVAVGLAALAAGCENATARTASGRLTVDATVAPIVDIVHQVVGDRATVTGLIPEGVDSHTFEPSPATVKALQKADVLFMDGLHLEGSTLSQAKANMHRGSQIVQLGDMTITPTQYAYDFTFPESRGDPNPHVWMDPVYVKRWSEIIRDVMVTRDPANAGYYRSRQVRFAGVLDTLDSSIAASINSIPEQQRKLLTYHDSFAYFSRRYGIPVLGAVQPSDFSEPSPREIQALIDQVKVNHVPAIFGSEVFPSTVLRQVAAATGARYVDTLRDDELPGDPKAPIHSYVGLMVDDVRIMTRALGGDPASLNAVPIGAP